MEVVWRYFTKWGINDGGRPPWLALTESVMFDKEKYNKKITFWKRFIENIKYTLPRHDPSWLSSVMSKSLVTQSMVN